eukprot:gene2806-12681_t
MEPIMSRCSRLVPAASPALGLSQQLTSSCSCSSSSSSSIAAIPRIAPISSNEAASRLEASERPSCSTPPPLAQAADGRTDGPPGQLAPPASRYCKILSPPGLRSRCGGSATSYPPSLGERPWLRSHKGIPVWALTPGSEGQSDWLQSSQMPAPPMIASHASRTFRTAIPTKKESDSAQDRASQYKFMLSQGHSINPCNSKLHPAVVEAGILPQDAEDELCEPRLLKVSPEPVGDPLLFKASPDPIEDPLQFKVSPDPDEDPRLPKVSTEPAEEPGLLKVSPEPAEDPLPFKVSPEPIGDPLQFKVSPEPIGDPLQFKVSPEPAEVNILN